MPLSVDEILSLYESRGARMYGSEPVSQTAHALQCAMLAAEGGASAELIAASFLHDVGHLIAELPHAHERETDDVHQYLPIPCLRVHRLLHPRRQSLLRRTLVRFHAYRIREIPPQRRR